ncbi:scavenger receptor class B member 1-like [Hyposmocoma kahamanoa]|uniref:scavenger receptor class B member 1-like n=1 Tax=Hyposmocoma kahamanoa TaxID=1477025 RepID=UPI000E6D848C|nr:scavenger receptor class B member 1-like [Hyposmocoma kahamanoa]
MSKQRTFPITEYTRVTNGSFVHDFMHKEIEAGHLSVTLFNITNAERFMAGEDEKLKVEEGVTSQMSSYPYWTRVALDLVIKQLKSEPIVTKDVHSYLWGYEDNLLSLAHAVAPGSFQFSKIGILDRLYDSKNLNILEASIKDDDKFMIKKRNGKIKLQMSPMVDPEDCELCDTFENSYEGVGYPTGLTPEFPIRLYRIGLCRILDMEYHGQKQMPYGAEAMVYHFSESFYSLNHSKQNDGVLDMSDCFYGTPLAITKPHFLDMDPAMYSRIDGMKPDEKYRGWISVEPKSGMQVETEFSLQMNLLIKDISHNAKTRHFSDMILPICHLKIVQPPLPEESKDILNKMYGMGSYLFTSLKIFLFILTFISWYSFFKILNRNKITSKDVLKGMEKGMFYHRADTEKTVGNRDVPLMASENGYNNNDKVDASKIVQFNN